MSAQPIHEITPEFVQAAIAGGAEWQEFAACSDPNVDPVIFGLDSSVAKENALRLKLARQICQGCVVQSECLEYGIASTPDSMVYAGATPKMVEAMRKRRKYM